VAITFKPYTKIRIDGSYFVKPDAVRWYEYDTLSVLKEIVRVTTGRILLRYIQDARKGLSVTILPYVWSYIKQSFGKDAAKNLFNATEETAWGSPGDPTRGAASNVHFTKWVINHKAYMRAAHLLPASAGILPDELLLHELSHAARELHGREDKTSTGDHMVNLTEFFAITVANVYATDISNPRPLRPVRKDHHGAKTLTSTSGNLAEDFLSTPRYREFIGRAFGHFPFLANELACVEARFNPFRQYRDDLLRS
jgi:hypothetical protein